jgi:RNA-binding protein
MDTPSLTEPQRKFLRGLAHPLKPLIRVGNAGLSAALLNELDLQLEHHELLKVRMAAPTREERDSAVAEVARRSRSALVTRIGNIAVLYRPRSDKPLIALPGR